MFHTHRLRTVQTNFEYTFSFTDIHICLVVAETPLHPTTLGIQKLQKLQIIFEHVSIRFQGSILGFFMLISNTGIEDHTPNPVQSPEKLLWLQSFLTLCTFLEIGTQSKFLHRS